MLSATSHTPGGHNVNPEVIDLASLRRHAYRSTRWRMETAGLILAGGAWMAYGWVAPTTLPFGMSGWGQALAFTIACALRAVEVHRDERRTRQAVTEGLV